MSSKLGIFAALMVSGSVICLVRGLKLSSSPSPPKKKKKRVRFCDSVVEPKGDNRAFRSRPQSSRAGESEVDPSPKSDRQEPLTPTLQPQQQRPLAAKKVEALFGGAEKVPANRMVLYTTMYHDRVLKALY